MRENAKDQIVRLFNAARHQLITCALLRADEHVFILFLRRIKLQRASDYENFEAAAGRWVLERARK